MKFITCSDALSDGENESNFQISERIVILHDIPIAFLISQMMHCLIGKMSQNLEVIIIITRFLSRAL